MDRHGALVLNCCRVCSDRLGRVAYHCSKYSSSLVEVFSIQDICSNRVVDLGSVLQSEAQADQRQDTSWLPEKFCQACYCTLQRAIKARDEGRAFSHNVTVASWQPHSENCAFCEKHSAPARGRPKKRTSLGRPVGSVSKLKTSDLLSHDVLLLVAKQVCSDEYTSEPTCVSFMGDGSSNFPPERFVDANIAQQFCTCPVCMFVLDRPIRPKECEHCACFECWKQWLSHNDSCPHCRRNINPTTMQPAPLVQWNLLSGLKLNCNFANRACEATVTFEHFQQHVASCTHADAPLLPAQQPDPEPTPRVLLTTLADVAAKPLNEPLAAVEEHVLASLVKRASKQKGSAIVQVKQRKGPPISVGLIPHARVSSDQSSTRAKQQRQQVLTGVMAEIAGGEVGALAQQVFCITRSTRPEREALLQGIDNIATIQPDDALAMKVDLGLSWGQQQQLRRWLNKWKVSIGSEKRQRAIRSSLLSPSYLEGEIVGVVDNSKTPPRATTAAFVWCGNVIELVLEHLEQNVQAGRLVWKDHLPKGEVWLKVGGDKGGGSFKWLFQLANLHHPNSVDNTCIVACLEAADNVHNLHVCLDMFKPIIDQLQEKVWREKKVRVFLFGDYELLSHLYGHMGASCRYFCIYCRITAADAKTPPERRAATSLRSLSTMADELADFRTKGKEVRHNAKEYGNIVSEPFFNIPLDQVIISKQQCVSVYLLN